MPEAQQIAKNDESVCLATVMKLDRGFPLAALRDGTLVRCEHAAPLKKEGDTRAVIGDEVRLLLPEGHDKAIIEQIMPRKTQLVRKDPAERTLAQVLASNFSLVIIAQPIAEVNVKRLERELVLAHETGARVAVVLTKADLAMDDQDIRQRATDVSDRVGSKVAVVVVSGQDKEGIKAVRALIGPDDTAVLIGKSGVGKSSLINMLVGEEVAQVGAVRQGDGKGRHTTVSREIVALPSGGRVIDMPGVRGLGMWEADAGIGAAFEDIETIAQGCKFRDCKHEKEPGCAVRAALEAGEISPQRVSSYLQLKQETSAVRERHRQASWKRGSKKR